jgi:hypothetical protein
LLDDVRCNGKESYIWDCSHRGLNKHDCSHSQDAGVECLCEKGYTFDGTRCAGMCPIMYYHSKNICKSITAQMS